MIDVHNLLSVKQGSSRLSIKLLVVLTYMAEFWNVEDHFIKLKTSPL